MTTKKVTMTKKIAKGRRAAEANGDEVQRHHPWGEQLALNKNLVCTWHVDRNEGTSLFCFLSSWCITDRPCPVDHDFAHWDRDPSCWQAW